MQMSDTQEAQTDAPTKQKRVQPKPGLKLVDAIPDEPTREGKGSTVYFDLLNEIKNDEDLWGSVFQVNEFRSRNGARDAIRAITGYTDNDGEVHEPVREIPEPPEGTMWHFEARRFRFTGDDGKSKTGSRMYVQLQA
jgi:hypothetical protein